MAGKRIVIPNYMPALDLNGNPQAGAKITFWANETTTLAPIYTSAALTVQHPNPISADASGVFPSIFADEDTEFSVAITDADDNPISGLRNRDNIRPSLAFLDGVEAPVSGAMADVLAEDTLSAARATMGADQAANVLFLQTGTGAVARSQQDKNRDMICVKDFGALGDGTTDDAPAIRAAIAAASGRSLYFPDPSGTHYRCASPWGVIPDSTTLHGESKRSTKILVDYNTGERFCEMADGSALEKLYIDGNSKTCRGVQIMGAAGNQHMNDVRILNFANDCLYFEKNAGAGFNAVGLETYRVDGLTSSEKFAIKIEDAAGGLGPKHFFGLETGGNCSFDFGGANNVFVIGSTLADCKTSANTSSVHIMGCRMANAPTFDVYGDGVTIIGGDIYPLVTVKPGAVSCTIGPAVFNLGVVDESGSAQNQIFEGVSKSYTPAITTSGGSVTIGNGSRGGTYQRTGTKIDFTATFIVGSTTSFAGGGGVLRIGLPVTPVEPSVQINVTAYLNDASGPTPYFGTGFLEDGVAYVYFVREGGTITTGAPFTFADGDSVTVSGSYTL